MLLEQVPIMYFTKQSLAKNLAGDRHFFSPGGGGGGGGRTRYIKKVGMLLENFEIDP